MFFDARTQFAAGATRRNAVSVARRLALICGLALPPLALVAYPTNPPLGLTGAPGEGTCASCHGTLTAGSGIGVTFPAGLTYTPGGPAVNLTVALAGGLNGGFELSSRALNNNAQAGAFTAGAYSAVGTSGSVQYAFHTGIVSSWALTWTPPAANVGNVVMYVAGVTSGNTFSNTVTLTPAVATTTETLSVSQPALTFNYSGTAPPAQSVQVTSSGSAVAFTTAVATSSGGNWLSASPASGNTPLGVSVAANPAGLSAGSYSGTVTFSSSSVTNSPQTVTVAFNVTAPPPTTTPAIVAQPSLLSFAAASANAHVDPQTLRVTASDASQLSFTVTASTATGGNWLSVTPSSGTAPANFTVSADPSSLASGSYNGSISIASAGASNSPLAVPVTLTVGSSTPSSSALQFSFAVVDKQSGGSDDILLEGSGSLDDTGNASGGGRYDRYTPGSGSAPVQTVSTGTWKVTGLVSYTPPSSGGTSGGVLVLHVSLTAKGSSTAMPATLRIADTGSDKGVTLTVTGGDTFAPTGTGRVSIGAPSGGSSCSVPGSGGGDGTDR